MSATLTELATRIRADRSLGVRVYRTGGGLRYLFTHRKFDPAAEATMAWTAELHADPLYMRLCKAQECFRARLTPKPWRCDLAAPHHSYPWSGPAAEAGFRRWDERYRGACERFATCELIDVLGNPETPPEIAEIVRVHDLQARATSGLPLA